MIDFEEAKRIALKAAEGRDHIIMAGEEGDDYFFNIVPGDLGPRNYWCGGLITVNKKTGEVGTFLAQYDFARARRIKHLSLL